MRLLLYMFLVVLICSCSAKSSNKERDFIGDENVLEMYALENESEFSFDNMLAEKLQNYFEMVVLKEEHPEFKQTILLQLQKISKDSIHQKVLAFDQLEISNIKELEVFSDTLKKINIQYSFKNNPKFLDSINAYVRTEIVAFEGKSTTSYKIEFSKK